MTALFRFLTFAASPAEQVTLGSVVHRRRDP